MATTGPPLNATYMAAGEMHPHITFNALLDILNGGAGASAWTAWVPTWANVTLGNGVVTARYIQIGKLVVGRLELTLGATSAVSGDITFSLPVTNTGAGPIGRCRAFDLSASALYDATVLIATTTTAVVRVLNSSATYLTIVLASSTIPFTWATGDVISLVFYYEAA